MPPAHLFYYRARGLGAGGQTQWGYAVAVAAVSSRAPPYAVPGVYPWRVETETLPHSLADAEFEL
jgi:hypothetical protein